MKQSMFMNVGFYPLLADTVAFAENMSRLHLTVACVLTLAATGCSTVKPSPVVSQSFDLTRHTVVEVRMVNARANLGYFLPKTRGEGAASAARHMAQSAAHPFGLIVVGALTPVAALTGAMRGMSPEEIARGELALTKCAADLNLASALNDEVIRLGNQLTPYRWVKGASAAGKFIPGMPPPPANVLVLELQISAFGLTHRLSTSDNNPEPINPRLRLVGEVECLVAWDATPTKWMDHRVQYASQSHKFVQWAKADARLVREAAAECQRRLAGEILKQMFEAEERKP